MPGLNQKGPMGQGPMTGRRIGRCTHFGESIKNRGPIEAAANDPEIQENQTSEDDVLGWGRGFARGAGRGSGRRGLGRGLGRQNRFRRGC